MCPGAHPTRLRTFGVSHIQGLWRFCTCKTFGVSLHPGHLEHLCTKSFWDISAPGVSPSTSPCKTFGVSLHPEPLECTQTQNFRGITAPLEHFCIQNFLGHLSRKSLGVSHSQQLWGISHPELLGCLHSEPLEHFTPKTLGVSHTLGSGALGPGLSCRQSTQEGSLSPAAKKTPTHVALVAHPTPAPPCESASLGATAQPQGARGAGREANSCGSARSGAAGEPEGSGTDPCRAVSSRAGS